MANRRKRPNPWSKINGTGMRRIVILTEEREVYAFGENYVL